MAEEVAALQYRLEASTARFESQIRRAEKVMTKSAGQMEKGARGGSMALERLGRSLAAIAGPALAAGFGLIVTRALNAAEAIADMADRAGVSAERLQELRFAFTQNGVAMGEVDAALVRFNAGLGQFIQSGVGPAKEGLASIGVTSRQAAAELGSSEQAFDAVVKRLASIEDPARRAGAASQLFGEQAGPALAILIGKGAGAVEDLREKARQLGLVLSNDGVRAAAQASAELRALGQIVSTQVTNALIQLAPQIVSVTQTILDAIPATLRWAEALGQFFGFDLRPLSTQLDEIQGKIRDQANAIALLDMQGVGDSGLGDQARERLQTLQNEREGLRARAERIRMAEEQAAARRSQGVTVPDLPARGGGKKDKPTDAFEKLIETMRERQRAALDDLRVASAEEAQQDRLRASLDATRMARELENAALRDGKALTPELRAEIESMTGAYETVRNAIDAARQAQQDQAKAAEDSKRAIEGVADAFSSAINQADDLKDALKRLAINLASLGIQGLFGAGPLGAALGGVGRQIGGSLRGGGSMFQPLPMFASGTNYAPGGMALVGERGPELVNLPRGAQVKTAAQTARMMGGGGVTQNFDFRGATIDEIKFRRIAREESGRAVAGLSAARSDTKAVLT